MRVIDYFVNAVRVAEVEDGFISNRNPMSDDQRKAMYASSGGLGGGRRPPKKHSKTVQSAASTNGLGNVRTGRDAHEGFYKAPNIGEVMRRYPNAFNSNGKMKPGYSFGMDVNGRITSMSHNGQTVRIGRAGNGGSSATLYKPPVDVKDIVPWSAERDLARRISEYEDRTGHRWPGPGPVVDTLPPRIPIDLGGAIGQDSMGNPIFRGPNGNPLVYDIRTGGLRPPGLQMPTRPSAGQAQLGGSGGPVKPVTSIKGLSVAEAAARRNETMPGTIDRMIAEQDLMVAMQIERNRKLARGEASGLIADWGFQPKPGIPDQRILPVEPPVKALPIRDDMRDRGYYPTPGYGTPPSQRGGMRTADFRDRDGDMIDDRDQDGPGMPGYRDRGYKPQPWGYIPPKQDHRILPIDAPITTPGFRVPDQRILPIAAPPRNQYSSSDPNWKHKMLAELNKGTIAGRMSERRVQMTEPGWRVGG